MNNAASKADRNQALEATMTTMTETICPSCEGLRPSDSDLCGFCLEDAGRPAYVSPVAAEFEAFADLVLGEIDTL